MTMISDRNLSARSTLLSLPIEVLQNILQLAVREDQALSKSKYQTQSFKEFYFNRKANQESAYRIRFVCKRIDGAVVEHLFREVKIRLGWNCLTINPPLQELAEGAMGRVFRENARILILDEIISRSSLRFADDRHRDDEHNWDLPTEAWYHYPEPMTKEEKAVKYEELKEEVYRLLPVAMSSMSKLVEIRRDLKSGLDDLWRAMQAAGIQLRSLSVDDMSPSLLEYLLSFSGLHFLALSPPPPTNDMFGDSGQGEIASFLFNDVIVRHSKTLFHFAIADRDSDIRATLLIIKLIAFRPSHMLTTAEPSLSVHNAVTSIQHREISLLPEILTIEYDTGFVEYRLVTISGATPLAVLSSTEATWTCHWRYYAENTGWLGAECELGGGLRMCRRATPENLLRQRELEQRDRIAGRVLYAAAQKAKGVLPGNF
ncbi:hypothetical protein CPB83DRAFT_831666 [Crepidotus variabilis]|uniref:Uncharacterized protein n=1 Tax=Crepidotus variabilis TaxID=179855 RepID=A0A9P6JUV0_9AGAR|nr:hypothetical protein CPB83DRAFT_831666 [Crepidotus variabilis]